MPHTIWTIAPRAPATTTRQRLLDAAIVRFYEHGFHAVGIDAIIEDAGVTKTTFYNHFESKDDLIVAVLVDQDRRDMEALAEMLTTHGGDARAKALAIFDLIADWVNDPEFKGCLFINASVQFPNPNDPVNKTAAQHGASLVRVFTDLATEFGAPDPRALGKQFCMLVVAGITGRHSGSDMEAADMARDIAAALLYPDGANA